MKTRKDGSPWSHMGKDVIYVPPPNSRYLVLGPQELSFELSHEQVSVRWCHTCSHGGAVDL